MHQDNICQACRLRKCPYATFRQNEVPDLSRQRFCYRPREINACPGTLRPRCIRKSGKLPSVEESGKEKRVMGGSSDRRGMTGCLRNGSVVFCAQPIILMGAFAPFFPMLKTITYFCLSSWSLYAKGDLLPGLICAGSPERFSIFFCVRIFWLQTVGICLRCAAQMPHRACPLRIAKMQGKCCFREECSGMPERKRAFFSGRLSMKGRKKK